MSDHIQVQGINFEEMQQALRESPQVSFQFVGSEMKRWGNRFRKREIQTHMSGRPGMQWSGSKAIGGNIKEWVRGNSLSNLTLVAKGSRLLQVHETGATITPRAGAFLYLSHKSGKKGHGAIFAKVRSVTIPARLRFKETFNAMTPEMLAGLQDTLTRSMQVAFERHVKAVSGAIGRLAG